MSRDSDRWADSFVADKGQRARRILADEGPFEIRALARIAAWGVGSLAAVSLAILSYQTKVTDQHQQANIQDIINQQADHINQVAKDADAMTRRLSLAIDQLNHDRDRLYGRVTTMETALATVKSAIIAPKAVTVADGQSGAAPAKSAPSAKLSTTSPPLATLPAVQLAEVQVQQTPLIANSLVLLPEPPQHTNMLPTIVVQPPQPVQAQAAAKEVKPPVAEKPAQPQTVAARPPDTANLAETTKPVEPAKQEPTQVKDTPVAATPELPAIPAKRTRFGIDVGGANTMDGLRNLWRSVSKGHQPIADLQPVIQLRERGAGVQLRLIAGPFEDAAQAAAQCQALTQRKRHCETTVFEGQTLALASPAPAPIQLVRQPPRRRAPVTAPTPLPAPTPEVSHAEPPAAEPAPPPKPSFTSLLGMP